MGVFFDLLKLFGAGALVEAVRMNIDTNKTKEYVKQAQNSTLKYKNMMLENALRQQNGYNPNTISTIDAPEANIVNTPMVDLNSWRNNVVK